MYEKYYLYRFIMQLNLYYLLQYLHFIMFILLPNKLMALLIVLNYIIILMHHLIMHLLILNHLIMLPLMLLVVPYFKKIMLLELLREDYILQDLHSIRKAFQYS